MISKSRLKIFAFLLIFSTLCVCFVSPLNVSASGSYGCTDNSAFDMTDWKWHKSNGKWWYGTSNYDYAFMCVLDINNKKYAFDKNGYLYTNCFFQNHWCDSNGVMHDNITCEWFRRKADGVDYWALRVYNNEGYKDSYLSGKSEWFGNGFNVKTRNVSINWTTCDSKYYTFTNTGWVKHNSDWLTVSKYKLHKNVDWSAIGPIKTYTTVKADGHYEDTLYGQPTLYQDSVAYANAVVGPYTADNMDAWDAAADYFEQGYKAVWVSGGTAKKFTGIAKVSRVQFLGTEVY